MRWNKYKNKKRSCPLCKPHKEDLDPNVRCSFVLVGSFIKERNMSKKQKKSVEKVQEPKIYFCKDCKNRLSGSEARKKMLQGKCVKTDSFVKRKDEVCEKFKEKK
jgi:hypothetical protein